jgi:glucose-6-phosphate dehydrogenase assembly protein OpcA
MTPSPAISPGLPVELGEIERRLGELWDQSDAGKVRASLVNLVIYSESPGAIAANTPLLAEIAANHAFRALLVQGDPHAPEPGVRAWITAHCHLRDAGKTEICSEQITFQLDGPSTGRLPNIVFSHLDSDLPLYLWWQGDLHPAPDPQLWTWVDRLIVDSRSWSDPAAQFPLLEKINTLAHGRCAVCDLTWTRLFHLRYAAAHLFDHPAARARLGSLRDIAIRHAPADRITALEFLGWIASRLGWRAEPASGVFRRPDGGATRLEFLPQPAPAPSISAVHFGFGDATAAIQLAENGEFYLVDFQAPGTAPVSQMLPAGREKESDVLLAELGRSSRHPLFEPAIRAITPILPGRVSG